MQKAVCSARSVILSGMQLARLSVVGHGGWRDNTKQKASWLSIDGLARCMRTALGVWIVPSWSDVAQHRFSDVLWSICWRGQLWPLVWGWFAVVFSFSMRTRTLTVAKILDTNCSSLSVSEEDGIWYSLAQLLSKTVATFVKANVVTSRALVHFVYRPIKKLSCWLPNSALKNKTRSSIAINFRW